jgi:hypothetical protein
MSDQHTINVTPTGLWRIGDVLRVADGFIVVDAVTTGHLVATLTVHPATRAERLRARLYRIRMWLPCGGECGRR